MCQNILKDPTFFHALIDLDQKIASATQVSNCCFCGMRLNVANYPRKPRGLPNDTHLVEAFSERFSFCCQSCRKRHTPLSVRFLGRRVFLGVIVVLASALAQGLADFRLSKLESLGLSRQTLHAWLNWWRDEFTQSPAWREIEPSFVNVEHIPKDPLIALSADDLSAKILIWLKQIKSLSIDSSSLLRVEVAAQSF